MAEGTPGPHEGRRASGAAKDQDTIRASESRLKQRVLRRSPRETVWLDDTRGLPRISDRVMALAQPVIDAASSLFGPETAITLAVIAWNLSLLPEDERRQEIRQARKQFGGGPDAQVTFSGVLRTLTEAKLKLFPDDLRTVVDFDLVQTSEGFHFNVAAGIPKEALPGGAGRGIEAARADEGGESAGDRP